MYPLLNITLGKLAPTKCLTECCEVGTHTMMLGDTQSSTLSLGLSIPNAQLDSAHKLFNEGPFMLTLTIILS
uniref:Predicted protein n=1 Tax=Hordeum vulgare subsp. vulgare TaxID=112509 RepID=F2D595_HORVV|nr:predicted protein [Hordeum vulgare subsp. vulgare]